MLIRHTRDIAPSYIELFDESLMQTPRCCKPIGFVRHDGVGGTNSPDVCTDLTCQQKSQIDIANPNNIPRAKWAGRHDTLTVHARALRTAEVYQAKLAIDCHLEARVMIDDA
jgi:hypothetical protein